MFAVRFRRPAREDHCGDHDAHTAPYCTIGCTPFIDTVAEGMLQGKGGPAPGTPPGLPFAIHHHMISQMGIHHVENAKLDALAKDRVWTSCTMILPLLERGAAGSALRPVAIGVPGR